MYHHSTMVRKILCLKEVLIMQGQISKKEGHLYILETENMAWFIDLKNTNI